MNEAQKPEENASPALSAEKIIAKKLAEKSLDYFHEAMNDEISRLWQRSIFLVALLALIFAGYGNTLLKFFDSACLCDIGALAGSALNFVCIGISFFGILFSALWIMTTKGSKAWQEKYEHTLFSFIDDYVKKNSKCSDDELVVLSKFGFAHGYLKALEKGKFSNSLLRSNGGAYSVSKVNITLGIISLSFWIIVGFLHSLLVPHVFWAEVWNLVLEFIRSRFLAPFVFVAFSLSAVWFLSGRCKSSVIQDKQDEISKHTHENK